MLLGGSSPDFGKVCLEIETFKEFPIRQKPASFNLDEVMRKLSEPQGAGK